ncbi:MAG TPA: winged helix DNA-binding domain-containing protein, partial [Dehalococcoidia bacterium]|nr:winged helix DNA-binding domain-containing protein [Dehalococcoidia bacterium]
ADKSIVRTWPMRGTLHFVPAEDACWMLDLLTPRLRGRFARRYEELGLDESAFGRGGEIIQAALQGGKIMTRPEAVAALARAGLETADQRGYHILGHLAQGGLICFGPRQGKQFTFVLLDEWVPHPRRPEREEALGLLARRYFTSHGPATVQDFGWWCGLTVADIRTGIDQAGLASESIDGKTHWWASDGSLNCDGGRTSFLLPAFDEYLVAYRDRSAARHPRLPQHVTGLDMLFPVIVVDGGVVGTWTRRIVKDVLRLDGRLLVRLTRAQKRAVGEAAERYGAFVGMPKAVDLRLQ